MVRTVVVVGAVLLSGLLGPGEGVSVGAAESKRAIGVAPLASPAPVPIVGTYRALLIGIDEYADPRIADLEAPVKDVKAVRAVLETRYGFAPAHITTLLNEQASRAGIIDTLYRLQKEVGTDDSLFIYYAGHGQYEEDRGRDGRATQHGWWVPADADPKRPSSFIDNEIILKWIERMRARHVFLVADSCFSGSVFGTRALPPISDRWYARLYEARSRWGLTSGATEPVADSGSGGHSPFAYFLLKKLREHAGPYLVPSQIYDFVAPLVGNDAAQLPRGAPLKGIGDKGGQFVFRVAEAETGSPGVAPAPTPEGAQLMLKAQQLAMEQAFWDSVKDSDNPEGFQAYLDEYPDGIFAALAKQRLEDAKQGQQAEKQAEEQADKAGRLPPALRQLEREMVAVAGGTFTMGCTREQRKACSRDEKPAHRVRVADFQMSRYEVTQALWEAVMGENPSRSKKCPRCPVEEVSWNDVQVFLRKLNALTGEHYRLPSEAEWEYAARGGQQSRGYKYAGSDDVGSVAWYGKNSGGRTHPVGQKEPNELGLYDMSGNVWEWVADCWHNSYAGAPTDGRAWMSGACPGHVVRGGSWGTIGSGSGAVTSFRSSHRFGFQPDFKNYTNGFRVARTLSRAAAQRIPSALQELGRQMVTVSSGTFTMGCMGEQRKECSRDEKTAHRVRVADFQIGRYEVTQALWEAVMGENPSFFKKCPQCPVEQVNWDDVQEFLKKLNAMTGGRYRLPSEAEWEYAARGGQQSRGDKYAGSDDPDSDKAGRGRTVPVGQKEANELGLYDMNGNVGEWVADCWHDSYAGAPTDGRAWVSGTCAGHVFRGGSWYMYRNLGSAFRGKSKPGFRLNFLGFRAARTLAS